MCILASRDHTCIHPQVSKAKNKTEECRKSVENKEGKSCRFHARARYVRNQEDLEDYGITKAWDISELVEIGEKIQGCPYYMTREIVNNADIIFCPYNYLIDPIIREQMDISLANQIVILDEAHNIEDSSRAAASWSVTPNSLDEAMKDLDYFVSKNIHREQHQVLHEVCATIRRWIVAKAENQTGCRDYSKSSKIWEGQELKQALNDDLCFVPAFVRQLTNHFKKVLRPPEPGAKDKRERTNMNAATAALFEGLLMVLYFIMKDDYKHLCDYRVAITKEYALVPAVMPNGFRRKGEFEKKLVYTLNFWCLSPAVVFSEISQESRSVILTSGTLSPMSTFSSELGCKFPIQLEANHVVGSSQVWVSSLAVGPSGSTLNATYRFAETFEFQDEIGEAIHRVCEVVPHGVLCFLPSYSMLDKLMNRWKMTGLWGRLCRVKNTFSEPRRGDKTDFNDLMTDFYDCIKLSEDSDGEYGTSGALFFAVCRGKVSEGLDFADNNARAVITVGIPFSNVKDIQVELKRKYNNQYCSAKGLLNGNEWYEIQAYRALNQALGRCIRHRNDWGAILLIDERFGKSPKYRNGLSKWIRGKVVHHNNFPNLISSLKKFAEARLENPCPNKTMLQTPTATPRRSTDSNETKSNQESPISVNSRSQCTQTPPQKMDIRGVKQEPGLITTPTSNCHQTTSQLVLPVSGSSVSSLQQFQYTPQKPTNQTMSNTHRVSRHNHPQVFETANQISEQTHVTVASTPTTPRLFISANQVSSSTPVVGRGVVPKMLPLTPLNCPQLAGTADSLQRMPNPQQMVNVQHIVIPQTSGNNGVIFNIFGGGQPTTPGAGSVQLGGVGQGIRLNITGQPGAQNIRFNMTTQPRPESTSGGKVGLQGPMSTPGVNAGVQGGGLLSTPGIVRVKQEPQSPPEIPRENKGQTSGVNQGSNGAQGCLQAKGNRILRKPLFSSNESLVPGNKEMNKEMSKDVNGGQNENAGYSDVSTLLKRRNNAPKPLEISGYGLTEPKDGVLTECGDPDSPLLFCTPPTPFESSDDDDTKGGKGVDRVEMGHMGIRSDRKVLEDEGHAGVNRVNLELFGAPVDNMNTTSVRKIPQKDGGEGVLVVKSEPMDTTMDRKVHEGMEMVGVTKNNDGPEGMDGSDGNKDILDILDDAVRTIISNNVTWNVKCKACDSAFYSTVNSTSDDVKPREEEVFTDTMLGNILNSLFSLNTNRRKKTPPSLTTLHVPDVNVLQGCCPAFAYHEGKQNKQDMKLNSIYCEEESRCYISLVCKQCKESRTARGRSIIAVRAVPCGSGENKTKSMIWFNRDKVEMFSPG
ncbi:Fanconi anemia group J, partial [Paramuricea clavata]